MAGLGNTISIKNDKVVAVVSLAAGQALIKNMIIKIVQTLKQKDYGKDKNGKTIRGSLCKN